MWTPRNIYLYLVSLISLIIMIIGLIISANALIDSFIPNYTRYPSYEEFYNNTKATGETKAQYDARMAKQKQQDAEFQRISNIRNIKNGLIMTVVALPFYLYHWKKIESDKNLNKENPKET